MNVSALASSPLSSTGISITIPRKRSGAAEAISSAVFAPSEVPITTACSMPEMVHQRDHLLAEDAHRIAPHVAWAIGFAVAEQVDRDHAVPARREIFGERAVHLLGEQQPMDEDHRAARRRRALRGPPARALLGERRRAAAVFGVGDALVLEAEGGHSALTSIRLSDQARVHTEPGRFRGSPGLDGVPPRPSPVVF